MKKDITITGMSCQHCVHAVKEALSNLSGIQVDRVEIGIASLSVDEHTYDTATVAAALEEEGFKLDEGSD